MNVLNTPRFGQIFEIHYKKFQGGALSTKEFEKLKTAPLFLPTTFEDTLGTRLNTIKRNGFEEIRKAYLGKADEKPTKLYGIIDISDSKTNRQLLLTNADYESYAQNFFFKGINSVRKLKKAFGKKAQSNGTLTLTVNPKDDYRISERTLEIKPAVKKG